MPQKLVRARVKAEEHLPEWAKCCDRALAAYKASGEFTVDLASSVPMNSVLCIWCDQPKPPVTWVLDPEKNEYAELELLDLDEGEIPAEQPHERAVAG